MKEKTTGYSQSSYGGYQSQGNPYGGQGNPYGNQQGNPYGEWNPFEDIFGQFSGYYTNGGAQQRQKTTTGYEKDTHLRAAGNYVRNGYYQEARNVLDGMEPARRNARWYYYSAAANQGLGNNVTAMEHAKQAVPWNLIIMNIRCYYNSCKEMVLGISKDKVLIRIHIPQVETGV